MTIWVCTRCGSPNGSVTESCFRCGAPKAGPAAPTTAAPTTAAGVDEPSLVPLARYDVLPPGPRAEPVTPAYPPHGVASVPGSGPPPPGVASVPGSGPPSPGVASGPPMAGPPPPFEPVPYRPPPSGPDYGPAQPRRWWIPVLVGLVVLLAIGAVATVVLVEGNGDGGEKTGSGNPTATSSGGASSPDASANPSQPTGSATPGVPGSVGVVAIDPAVTDPRAAAVAAMFDSHFSAVNAKDYARALAAYDPAGVINPNDAAQAAQYRNDISTTTDDQVVLRSVEPDPTGSGVLAARVTFKSNQQAGFGPRERPNETCTAWDVTYTLSQPGGTYKILAGKATNAPC